MQGETIIDGIIQKTENEAIFMFILILMAAVLILLPLYKLSISKTKERQKMENERWDKYIQRESSLIEVITRNTEVISELKILFLISSSNFSFTICFTSVTSVDNKVILSK